MNEKDLKKIEQEIISNINNEIKTDEEIREKAMYAAELLMQNPRLDLEIDETVYAIKFTVNNSINPPSIFMIATNIAKYTLVGSSYRPYTINVEINENYSLKENLAGAIEAFIRHITGNYKPEVLEE